MTGLLVWTVTPSIYVSREGRHREPSIDNDLAALGDRFLDSISQSIPGIDIYPEGLLLIGVRRILLERKRELHHFVACVREGLGARILTDMSYNAIRIDFSNDIKLANDIV